MKILITGDISTWNIENFDISKINENLLRKIQSYNNVIYNLEGPIGDSSLGKPTFSENPFKNSILQKINNMFDKEQPQVFSDEKILDLLKQNPNTIVTLANNHIKDLGLDGFINTISLLEDNKIRYVGAENKGDEHNMVDVDDQVTILNFNFIGKKYTFNLYGSSKDSFGASSGNIRDIKNKVTKLKKKGKQVILILHIGKELVDDISKWDVEFEEIKKIGADVTVIHHPHMYIQTKYEKDNMFVLGDFLFVRPEKFDINRKTAILEIEIDGNRLNTTLNKILVSEIYKY